jgi:hypothetical protein
MAMIWMVYKCLKLEVLIIEFLLSFYQQKFSLFKDIHKE